MRRRQFMAGVGVLLGGLASSCATSVSPRKPTASRPSGAPLSSQALEDTLLGSSYMGCGGGGGLQDARDLIRGDLAAGLSFQRLPVARLGDEDMVASPYALGSLAPMGDDMRARLERLPPPAEPPTIASFHLLEQTIDREFAAVIIGEIGPLSMAEAMSLAARIGIPSLDADTVGRATPEINQHSVRVAGHAITPAAAVTLFGDEVILKHVQDPSREEDVLRSISVVSQEVGVTDAAISGKIARAEHVLVQGSLSLAEKFGRAVREAKASGNDPIAAARRAGDGFNLFDGVVESFNWEDRDGFLIGDVHLDGAGDFAGQQMRLDYKNEHLLATRDGRVIATCPDLITMIDRRSAEGIGNPDFEKGQRVSVLGFRAPALWRRPAGLAVFSPRYFGYDVDYVPIEKRLNNNS